MKDISSIAESGILFDGRYKLLKPLSSDGGTADVWLALDTNTIDEIFDEDDDTIKSSEETGIKVAIKIYRPKNALDIGEQRFREEFKIVFNCHHTNLVQPINFSIFDGIPYLVLPYCQNGSSESLQGKISDSGELWRYILDVSSGLAYLHAFNPTIVHHDIKPANILIDDSDNFAITDFGISSHRGLNREGYTDSHSGTMAYMAPERFREDYESTPESDIWSFGATLYELITGKVPFGEDGGLAQLNGERTLAPITQPVPKDIKALISDCLSLDISKRPSAAYIKRAAEEKHYPIRNKARLYSIMGGGVLIAAIAAIALLLGGKDEKQAPIPQITDDEKYAQATELLKSDRADDLSMALAMLDTLGNKGHIPAIYEQAFTYGWNSDSASVVRKKILNIEMISSDKDPNLALMPKSHHVNNKAIGLLTRIEEMNDPRYPEINANALFRLACYYVNPNQVFQKDYKRAKDLLLQARVWAEQCNDKKLLQNIDYGLSQLKYN